VSRGGDGQAIHRGYDGGVRLSPIVFSAALVLVACSRHTDGDAVVMRGAPSSPPPSVSATGAIAGGPKPFGVPCVEDAECAGGVCFHKRIKGADAGPERRDVHPEAEEHDGFCSMHCDSDTDCPTPPTRGKCGARGMCK
jgi:hypothetical protein